MTTCTPSVFGVRRLWLLAVLLMVALSSGAQGIERGTLADDTPWQTSYVVMDSGVAGPTVMIVGGVHGDEPAGAGAAEQVVDWPVLRGRLIVVPRANVLGLAKGTRKTPHDADEPIDLNRSFPADGEPAHPLAKAIWALVLRENPDWLIDLHEGFDFHQQNADSVGASVIFTRGNAVVDPVVKEMLKNVNATIDLKEQHLVELSRSGPVNGSLANAAEERGIHAMILETCKKDQRLPLRVRQHRVMVGTLLARLKMIEPETLKKIAPVSDASPRIALFDDGGVGGAGPSRIESIMREAGCVTRRVDGVDVRNGALSQFDLVVFPGGSGSAQAKSLGEQGRDRVKGFVEAGGGYVGICAGAYLATANYDWSLKIIDAKTLHTGKQWNRGVGQVQLQWTGWGAGELDVIEPEDRPTPEQQVGVRYANGPIIGPAGRDDLEDYAVVAWFRSELAKNGTEPGLMVDTPAVIAGRFGKGRVVAISPHPESTEGLEPFVKGMLLWAQEGQAAAEVQGQ